MKFFTSLFLLSLFAIAGYAGSDRAELFAVDHQAVNAQMTELNRVENYVNEHPGTTLDALQQQNSSLLNNINLNSSTAFISSGDGPAGIPSFLWGCILGWIGILIVYLITEDSEETKKALYGCIAQALTGCLLYVLFWVLFWGAAWGGSFWWY